MIQTAADPTPRRPRLRRWTVRLAWAYAVFVASVALAVWQFADEAVLPTLLLFGPRWVIAGPLAVLAPAAAVVRSRAAAVAVVLAGVIVAGPITGGHVNLGGGGGKAAGAGLRIVTWNIGGGDLTRENVRAYFRDTRADILVLQETIGRARPEVFPDGWHVATGTMGTAVASRFPVKEAGGLAIADLDAHGGVGRYLIDSPGGQLVLVNVHLPTQRNGIEAVLQNKFGGFPSMRATIAERAKASGRVRAWVGEPDPAVFVCGDFNMPAESTIFQRDWSVFGNAFGDAGVGWGTTKQTRWFGSRIDHILYAPPWRCAKVRVGPDLGSDHRPVLAEFVSSPEP